MPFYKRENEELIVAPNFVIGPGFELRAETHSDHTYPVEGWYWFDTLDQALTAFAPKASVDGVSPRQIRHAMNQTPYGESTLREAVEAAVAQADQDLKDWWLYSTVFERHNPQVEAMAQALGITDTQLEQLWLLASSL